MQTALRSPIPDASLAVFPVNGENSHQGFEGRNPAPHPVREACKFTVLLGLRGQAELNRIGSRSTGKDRGRGTGLGLSMVYGFARQSHGGVRITSELGHGTTVDLYLPFAEKLFASVETSVDHQSHAGSGTILIVDDEESLVQVAKDHLTSLGYVVVVATDGPSALTILRSSQNIDLILTDVIMGGGMDGMELAKQADDLRPGIPVIYSSGFSADALSGRTRPLANSHILQKPYRLAELSAVVRKALQLAD